MVRTAMRKGWMLAVATGFALLVSVAGASGSPERPVGPLGMVPHRGSHVASLTHALLASTPTDLAYHGGPVMHTNTTYAIYWIPGGSTACGGSPCSASANYEALITQFFRDVAAASGDSSNVYSVGTQYADSSGPVAYASSFGGSWVDTADAFPSPSDCNDGVDSVCLTDANYQGEVQSALNANPSWQSGPTAMFFVMTPDGVGSCYLPGDTTVPGQQCTTTVYCAYHSAYGTEANPTIYAVEPYDATIPGCWDGTSPNGDAADAEINTISHEHNEAITDPLGDAWWTNDPAPSVYGSEMADLCGWNFGTAIAGTPGVDAYNQVINGHDYWLQQEYSNDGSACAQRYPFEVPNNTAPPTVAGVAAQGQALSGTQGSWSQAANGYVYQWLKCASQSRFSCFSFPGDTAPTYTPTANDVGQYFELAVYAHNAFGTSLPAVSAMTAAVVPVPADTTRPVVSGIATVGQGLTTSTGTWNTAASFTYQWNRCDAVGSGCAPIAGATAATHPVTAADAGHTLQATVSATNAAGTTTASSSTTPMVVAIPHATTPPRISGRAKVGHRLSGSQGRWTGPPSTYRYQWLRCNAHAHSCVAIAGATHSAFRPTKHDIGRRLRERVAARNRAGTTAATSSATARIRA